mgnify:CR=1 FL=1
MSPASAQKILLSAVKPTNFLTLGNYLGALKNWVKLQSQYDCLFFVVDLHAITVRQDPKELRESTYFAVANYIAAGIDPHQSILFVQSHVPEHAELSWILTCFTYMGELNRMTQFKDKAGKEGTNIGAGLFNYPVLMAADVLLYQTNLVPVGADQKQHLELTRDIAIRMNNIYGKDLFTVPDIYIPPVGAKIMNLQDPTSKMSKSDDEGSGNIYLSDSDDVITKKIKRAVTDSKNEINYSEDQPGVQNLITIQSAILGKTPQEIVASYAGKQYGHLKVETAEIVAEHLKPIRQKAQDILKDKAELDRIFKTNAEKARERAQKTLKKVYERIGFVPR